MNHIFIAYKNNKLCLCLLVVLVSLLAGCSASSGNAATPAHGQYSVGGMVDGLHGTLVLQNNGGDDLEISANGAFGFDTPLTDGASYIVTIKVQPIGQACAVSNESGVISSSDISNVLVVCASNSQNIDTSFGVDGKIITSISSIGSEDDLVHAGLIQNDGKIIAAGQSLGTEVGTAYYFDFSLVRYNIDGTLDNTFGSGGKVTTTIGLTGSITDIAAQSDGKVVAAGWSMVGGGNPRFTVARYNTDGSLDTNFGVGGVVLTTIGSGSDYADSLAIQSDGKIVVSGSSWNGAHFDFALVRYDSNGNLDNTFGVGGVVTTAISTSLDSSAYVVKLQTDGKIVAAGDSGAPWDGINFQPTLVRYNSDGTLDNSFGINGKVVSELGVSGVISDIIVDGSGTITATGNVTVNTNAEFAIIRYNADGSLDTSFGNQGMTTTAIGAGDSSAVSMALQADGKVVVAGVAIDNSNDDFALARYNLDGTLDNTFGSEGLIVTDFGSDFDHASTVLIQVDGKIVVVGNTALYGNNDFMVVRYMP